MPTVTQTPIPSNTPTPKPTQTHTATPTNTLEPTAVLPTSTVCPVPSLEVAASSVNFRTGPGTNYMIQVPALLEGDMAIILGVNDDGTWFNIEIDERTGWVFINAVEIFEADCHPIEVVATIPPSPIPTNTPIPTETPVPTSVPSSPNPNPNPTSPPAAPTAALP